MTNATGLGLRRLGALALSVALAAGAMGCGGGDDGAGPDGDSAAEATPRSGGSLTFLASGEVPGLYPDTGGGPVGLGYVSGADRRFAIYDALAIEDEDTSVRLRIAESITTEDGIHWTVVLRPGVTFSDGTPLDAEAVRWNWERVADPERESPHGETARAIAAYEVVDDRTLEVTLAAPDAGFPRTVARSGLTFIGSPTAFEELGDDFATAPVGADAYVVEEWIRDDRLVLTRNPEFYGETHLDEVVFRPIVDEDQRVNTMVSGGGDINTTTDVNIADRGEDGGAEVHTSRTSGGYSYVFNMARPPFDDVRARRAVALATDPVAMLDTLYGGRGVPTSSIFLETSPFHDPEVAMPTHDADQAQDLLDVLAADGTPLSFTVTVPDSSLAARAEWLQSYLLSTYDGLDVAVDVVPAAQYASDRRSGSFEMIMSFTRFNDPDPALYNALHTGGGENYAGYSDEEMDASLEAGRVALDEADRVEAYTTVQGLLARDLPYYITSEFEAYNLTSEAVGGFATFSDGVPRWDLIWRVG